MRTERPFNVKNDARGSPRIDATRPTLPLPLTETQRFPPSDALARYEQELAYYRADAPFLTIEKRAQRCAILSLLRAAALAAGRH